MADDLTVLGLDTSEGVAAVLDLEVALHSYLSTLKGVTSVSASFSDEGKLATATIISQTRAGDRLSSTLRVVGDGYELMRSTATSAVNALKASADALKEIREGVVRNNAAARDAVTGSQIGALLAKALEGSKIGEAFEPELRKFDRAIRATADNAVKAGFSIKEVSDLFTRFASGGGSFTKAEQQIVDGFVRASAAASEFGNAADAASNRLATAESRRIRNVQSAQAELFAARERGTRAAVAQEEATARQLAAITARGALTGALSFDIKKGSVEEVGRFREAINGAINQFVKGKLTLEQFDSVFQKVIIGSKKFSAEEIGLANAIQKAVDAEGRFGDAAVKAGNDAIAAARKQTEANAVGKAQLDAAHAKFLRDKETEAQAVRALANATSIQGAIGAAFGPAAGIKASEAELTKFEAAVAKVGVGIAKLKIDPAQLVDVFTRAEAGVTSFVGAEELLYQKYLAIKRASADFGNEAKADAEKAAAATRQMIDAQAKLSLELDKVRQKSAQAAAEATAQAKNQADAEAVKLAIKAAFAPNAGLTASLNETKSLDGAINRLVSDIQSGKVPANDLYAALVKMASGATTFSAEEGKIVVKLQAVQAASQAVGTAAEADANRAAVAQKRLAAEIDAAARSLAKQKAEALKGQAKDAGVAGIRAQVEEAKRLAAEFFKIQQQGKSPQQLLAFSNGLRLAIDLLRQGKVDVGQFGQALNNLKAGRIETDLPANLQVLQARLNATKNALEQTGQTGESAGQRIFLSWQNVVRIFQSQVLFSVFSRLQSEFSGSVQAAADYSKQVALIQTISQDAGLSSARWADSIRRVSDELGNPIAETAGAAYDLLSNQVTRGADTITTLRSAIEFSRTTNSSATDAVNLLSSAINSFDLKAGDAEKVAAQFFTVIDLGRVKASELANNFNRVAELGGSLGVKLEELGAGISSLTRRGIKSNEAYTLMNNVFLKLIKPTESLQAKIKSWGFETGQSAVEALGFVGVLEKLNEAYAGNTAAIAKDFDELRGARGVISLTGKGLDEFKKDLEEIGNSGDKYKIAKKIVSDSDGQKLQIEFNKIKNFFINEVGGQLLRAVIAFSDKVGGISNAVRTVVGILKTMAIVAGTAFAIVKINAFLVAVGTVYLNVQNYIALLRAGATVAQAFGTANLLALGPVVAAVGLVAGALAALYVSYGDLGNRAHEAAQEIAKANQDAADRAIAAQQEFSDRHQKITEQLLDRAKQAFLQYAAEVRSVYEKIGEALKDEGERIAESIGNTFAALTGIVQRNVSAIESESKRATAAAEKAAAAVDDVNNDLKKEKFDSLLKAAKAAKNLEAETRLVLNRVQELRAEGATFLDPSIRDTQKGIEKYKEAIRVLTQLSAQQREVARYELRKAGSHHANAPFDQRDPNHPDKPLKVKVQEYKWVRVGTDKGPNQDSQAIFNQQARIAAELSAKLKGIEAVELEIAEAAAKEGAREKVNLEILKDKIKALKDFSLFDKKGNVKGDFEGEEGRAKAAAERAKLVKEALDALNKSGAALPARSAALAAFAEQYLRLQKEIEEASRNFTAQLTNVKELESIAEKTKAIGEAYKLASEAAKNIAGEVDKGTAALERQNAEVRTLIENLKAGVEAAGFEKDKGTAGLFGKSRARDAVLALVAQLGPAFEKAGTEAGDRAIKALIAEIDAKLAESSGLLSGPLRDALAVADKDGGIAKSIDDVLFDIKRKLTDLGKTKVNLNLDVKSLSEAQRHVLALKAEIESLPDKFKGFGPAASAAAEGIAAGLRPAEAELRVLTGETANAIKALNELERALNRTNAARAGGGPVQGRAQGGPIGFYAGGGFLNDFFSGRYARGTDKIPIMASRGEYMVNADSTRQFLPLLRAINSGSLAGLGRGAGNTSVGDINVTVQGGSSSEATVKSIANGLRRGLRTGTIKLQN